MRVTTFARTVVAVAPPVRKVLVRGGAEYVGRAVMPLPPSGVRLVPTARPG